MRGKYDTIKIYLIGMIYGLILENGGPLILPQFGFEGFFWENNYKLYLFEFFGYGIRISKVPIATHLGWPMVFYIAIIFWEQICRAFPKIKHHTIISGLIISSSGLMFDLPFDIIATRFNWWVWNENLLPLWFGVPLVNYLAWFWAVFMFGYFWTVLHNKKEKNNWSESKLTKNLAIVVPLIWILDTIGFVLSKELFNLFGLIYI